ncbi:hypothetical protein SRHO_G00131550 [Serrasalmus rhombeus]
MRKWYDFPVKRQWSLPTTRAPDTCWQYIGQFNTHVTGFCKVIIHMIHMPIQLLLNGHVTGVHQRSGVSELVDGNRRADTAAKAVEREGQSGVSLRADSVSSMKRDDADSEGQPAPHLRPAEDLHPPSTP